MTQDHLIEAVKKLNHAVAIISEEVDRIGVAMEQTSKFSYQVNERLEEYDKKMELAGQAIAMLLDKAKIKDKNYE